MKQLISIVLSLLMLLSSTEITYAQHFCGDFEMAAKVTLGQEKLSCGMSLNDSCGNEDSKTHSCCDNEYSQIQTDDNFTASDFDFQVSPIFAATFVSIFLIEQIPLIKEQHSFFAHYNPPPLIKDIPVFYETFLI